jgi:putative membrane protein
MAENPEAEHVSKQTLAEEQTDWADERARLARERTFSAWMRTGLAAVATGIGMARLLVAVEPRWLVQMMDVIFVMAGGVLFGLGFWRYRKNIQTMLTNDQWNVPLWMIGLVTILLLAAAFIGLLLIFLDKEMGVTF